MSVETIVSDVKGAVQPYVSKGQDVVTLSFETLKQANTIVFDGVQDLVKTNIDAGKDLISAAQSSFEKAKSDGIKAVVTKPIEYLPEGKDVVVSAYKDSYSIVTKAGEDLYHAVKKGFDDVTSKLSGSTTVSAETKKAKAKVRKTVKKATSTVKKAAEEVQG
ncbi:MAG: phasin family protein [Panacagrimonas sp.]